MDYAKLAGDIDWNKIREEIHNYTPAKKEDIVSYPNPIDFSHPETKIPKTTELGGNLTDRGKELASDTKNLLDLLVYNGYLNGDILKGRVLDWGAGVGNNTSALVCFGGYVEAVDITDSCKEIVRKGILSEDRVYETEGIKFLQERPQEYDLITAFLFGPIISEKNIELLLDFYEAASISIKPKGKILLTSDLGSFENIKLLEKECLGTVSKIPMFSNVFIGEPAKEPINKERFFEEYRLKNTNSIPYETTLLREDEYIKYKIPI